VLALISDWLQNQATELAVIAAAVTAFGYLAHKVYVFFKTAAEIGEFIRHELKENSGRSLHDYTVRNDRRFEWLIDQMGLTLPDELKAPTSQEGTTP
jgi:hypothetical protein